MKLLVPRFRHALPHTNPRILDAMFIEIDERDLPKVIEEWARLDLKSDISPKKFFESSSKEVCQFKTDKHVLLPYLQREHVTIHCGAKDGDPAFRDMFYKTMFEAGERTALAGANLWYGGGDRGLMGAALKGFLAGRLKWKGEPLYAIQVIPARFALGNGVRDSINGMIPHNEGICWDADIAIIMPDFMTRREMLDNKCALALGGIGATGTIDEISDMLVHVKTGLRSMPIRIISPYIEQFGEGYWEPLRKQIERGVIAGMENPQVWDHVQFVATVEEAFAGIDFNKKLIGSERALLADEKVTRDMVAGLSRDDLAEHFKL